MGSELILAAAVAALVVGTAFGCTGRTVDKEGGGNMGGITQTQGEKIDFDVVTLIESGMVAEESMYELKSDGKGGVIISQYLGRWRFDDTVALEDCVIRRAVGGAELYEKAAKLLGECNISDWAGFTGYNPNVLDGISFTFEAKLSDGKTVYASGSNAFPENYHKLNSDIYDLLEEYGEEIPRKQ